MADILTERQSRAFSRLKAMMHTYLVERDVEKTLSFYTEDIQSIGTGAQEVTGFRGRATEWGGPLGFSSS